MLCGWTPWLASLNRLAWPPVHAIPSPLRFCAISLTIACLCCGRCAVVGLRSPSGVLAWPCTQREFTLAALCGAWVCFSLRFRLLLPCAVCSTRCSVPSRVSLLDHCSPPFCAPRSAWGRSGGGLGALSSATDSARWQQRTPATTTAQSQKGGARRHHRRSKHAYRERHSGRRIDRCTLAAACAHSPPLRARADTVARREQGTPTDSGMHVVGESLGQITPTAHSEPVIQRQRPAQPLGPRLTSDAAPSSVHLSSDDHAAATATMDHSDTDAGVLTAASDAAERGAGGHSNVRDTATQRQRGCMSCRMRGAESDFAISLCVECSRLSVCVVCGCVWHVCVLRAFRWMRLRCMTVFLLLFAGCAIVWLGPLLSIGMRLLLS